MCVIILLLVVVYNVVTVSATLEESHSQHRIQKRMARPQWTPSQAPTRQLFGPSIVPVPPVPVIIPDPGLEPSFLDDKYLYDNEQGFGGEYDEDFGRGDDEDFGGGDDYFFGDGEGDYNDDGGELARAGDDFEGDELDYFDDY